MQIIYKKQSIGNRPEKILMWYAGFYEKMNIYANERYANMQSACFCVYLKKLLNTLHLTPYL